MKRFSRDTWLAIVLFVMLAALTAVAAVQQATEDTPLPLALTSSAPDGARALWLWLDALEYPVSDVVPLSFEVPANTGLIFMLEATTPASPDEWEIIDTWVNEGGTLVIVGDGFGTLVTLRHYDFILRRGATTTSALTTQSPLMRTPPLTHPVNAQSRAYLEPLRDDFVTHLASTNGPVVVSIEQGAGRVIINAAPYTFSNAGLKENGNPPLVLNMIAAANRRGTIWFDRWHQGIRANPAGGGEILGPGNWLRYTPAGRALLYTALIIFAGLILSGQRFGRAVPLARELARRAPLEYITAIANLSRRAGHRQAALNYYHYQLKRDLGQRYRLSAALPDGEFVTRLAAVRFELNADALRQLLARLSKQRTGENEMIQLATEVADWLKET